MISTRVVLLQVVPQFTLLAVYAIATSSAPLFVHPNCVLFNKLYPPIIRDPFERAREQEADKYKNTTWIIVMSGVNIFVTQSRLLQHFVQLFIYVLSIAALYIPSNKLTLLLFSSILLPYCLAQSFVLVVGLYKALDLPTVDELRSAAIRKESIVALAAKNFDEDEIVTILRRYTGGTAAESALQDASLQAYVDSVPATTAENPMPIPIPIPDPVPGPPGIHSAHGLDCLQMLRCTRREKTKPGHHQVQGTAPFSVLQTAHLGRRKRQDNLGRGFRLQRVQ